MFVQADLPLASSFPAAAAALDHAIADGGLVEESRRAMAGGLEFLMPVGPRGSRHFPAREVIVRLLPARRLDQRVLVDLRWETIGATGRMFPASDAILQLAAAEDPNVSRLSIIGRYQPPLARLGQTLDSVVMSTVASATMSAMLREVAAQLANLTT